MPSRTDFCALDDVIVPPVPSDRAIQRARLPVETEAFLVLSRALKHEPEFATQRLVEIAMRLTDAESAGLSLEEADHTGPYFRWVATTGEFARYVNGTMPRDFSPCGAVLDGRKALVMRDPVRYYAYISQLHVPVRTVLLVPFARHGRLIGTVWVAFHTEGRSFSVDDLRTVQTLATFACGVLDATAQTRPQTA
jgi:GAF domain-containing protein